MKSYDPYPTAKRSLNSEFHRKQVMCFFLALSNVNFHSGSSVPSSRNASEASSQNLKSSVTCDAGRKHSSAQNAGHGKTHEWGQRSSP
eukprot:3538561-Prymnesium_polylepis.2